MTEPTPEAEPNKPVQGEMPFAYVRGEAVTTLPHDLYIPPDALEVFLEAFEGPLDLLLYLIKRQNLDILDIPIAEITRQYIDYIELMKEMRLELAAEYLVMAAMLAEIKSRMLLPRPVEESEEDDPRAELIRRLQEYERFKKAAEDMDELPRVGRDLFPVAVEAPEKQVVQKPPQVTLQELLLAAKEVLTRASMFSHHHVQMEPLSVRERMSIVLSAVSAHEFTEFSTMFRAEEGRMGVVVTLLAVLELIKESLIELVQSEPFAPIYVKAATRVVERGAEFETFESDGTEEPFEPVEAAERDTGGASVATPDDAEDEENLDQFLATLDGGEADEAPGDARTQVLNAAADDAAGEIDDDPRATGTESN